MAVDEIFACATEHDLASNRNVGVLLEANWRLRSVAVVEHNSHTGFGDTGLATLVDEVLEVLRSNGAHVGNSENKANGVQNVGFTRAIEASNRVE